MFFPRISLILVNRFKKIIAKIKNKDAELNMAFEYNTSYSFEEVKKKIKQKFKGSNVDAKEAIVPILEKFI